MLTQYLLQFAEVKSVTHHGQHEMALLCIGHQGGEIACASPSAEAR
jgi:hypothetical protein